MTHDGLVENVHIQEARETVARLGGDSLRQLAGVEPVLAGYVDDAVTKIAGKMALAGCDKAMVRGVAGELVATAVSAIEALRSGHFSLWQSQCSAPMSVPGACEEEGDLHE